MLLPLFPSLSMGTSSREISSYDFDVSVIILHKGIIEVKATGDGNLGGINFVNRLVGHFVCTGVEAFNRKIFSRAIQRLGAKRMLSSSTNTSIKVNSFFEGIDFNVPYTRVLKNSAKVLVSTQNPRTCNVLTFRWVKILMNLAKVSSWHQHRRGCCLWRCYSICDFRKSCL